MCALWSRLCHSLILSNTSLKVSLGTITWGLPPIFVWGGLQTLFSPWVPPPTKNYPMMQCARNITIQKCNVGNVNNTFFRLSGPVFLNVMKIVTIDRKVRVLLEILGGVYRLVLNVDLPVFRSGLWEIMSSILRLEQQQNRFFKIYFEFAYFSFLTEMINRHSYTPVVPSIAIPDSRAKCIPVFRSKRHKTPSFQGGTYLLLRLGVAPSPGRHKRASLGCLC